jgi:hypothetical protein
MQPGAPFHLARGCHLVVVAMFAQIMTPWHKYNGATMLFGRQDRSNSCMRHDQAGILHMCNEIFRRQPLHQGQMRPTPIYGPLTRLRHDFLVWVCGGKDIYRINQSVERKLGAHGNKNHNTDPAKVAPVACATCGHWVSQSSANHRAKRPEADISSALATESTQIVRAPRCRASAKANTPGSAPVDITTSGFVDRIRRQSAHAHRGT